MTLQLNSRSDFTLEAYRRVAWQGEGAAFGAVARRRLRESRQAFLDLLAKDNEIVIYGVTSGYGQMAHLRFTEEERRAHARKPMGGAAAAFGDPLPERVVRGIVFARLTNFVEGHAALSPDLAEAVAGLLESGPLPPVPAQGAVSAGEILPLSALFLPLARSRELAEKDSLALVNGSPLATALLCDSVLAARRRLELALAFFALSIEAIRAPLEHYDVVLEELWGDPDEAAVLRSLRVWIRGGDQAARRPYQAPVSWRILPRVLGQAWRALGQAETAAETALKAVSDNPVFLPPDASHPLGRCISTGGYHNAQVTPCLNALAACWADLALLADRHVTKLLDGPTSHLPDNLMTAEGGYIGCLGFAAASYAEEARGLAQATLLPGSEGGGFGQNDISAPNLPAWRREQQAGACLEAALACLAAVCSQAFAVTERQAPPRLGALLRQIRAEFPPMTSQRAAGPETAAVKKLITDKIYTSDFDR